MEPFVCILCSFRQYCCKFSGSLHMIQWSSTYDRCGGAVWPCSQSFIWDMTTGQEELFQETYARWCKVLNICLTFHSGAETHWTVSQEKLSPVRDRSDSGLHCLVVVFFLSSMPTWKMCASMLAVTVLLFEMLMSFVTIAQLSTHAKKLHCYNYCYYQHY